MTNTEIDTTTATQLIDACGTHLVVMDEALWDLVRGAVAPSHLAAVMDAYEATEGRAPVTFPLELDTPTAMDTLRAYESEMANTLSGDDYDDFATTYREVLMAKGELDAADITTSMEVATKLADLFKSLTVDDQTTIALEQALCPVHFVDYEICQDDDDPECRAVRAEIG